MTIGERIRYLRIRRNMKIHELGKATNTTRQTISRYETGAIAVPEERLRRIADVLGTSLEYLQGCTLESMLDSTEYDLLEMRKRLSSTESEEERQALVNEIEVMQESYEDLLAVEGLKDRMKPAPQEARKKVSNLFDGDLDAEATVTIKMSSELYWMIKKVAESSGTTPEFEIEKSVKIRLRDIINDETQ